MSLSLRKRKNERLRARGIEPAPGNFTKSYEGGVKRMARYIKRVKLHPVKIKNPLRYLHSQARKRAVGQ